MCRYLFFALLMLPLYARAQYRTPAQQIITNEDSLHQGLSTRRTVLSGYGSAYYQRDFNLRQSKATLERVVLFVGHQFNERIAFFSEMELENALVSGGQQRGELAMEQAFLKFTLNRHHYLVAGLFLPRIGILNENHLPVNFNGVERPLVETWVIPATWRELGVGLYGSLGQVPLQYTVAVVNGLDNARFTHGTGIRDGRAEGSTAWANNLAITGSVQYPFRNFRFQVSGYVGGTTGLNSRGADSLGLPSGPLGAPVVLGEADIQYNSGAFSAKALGAAISLPDAGAINGAYARNLPSVVYGAYAEVGYDVLFHRKAGAQLIPFARYETLDLASQLPSVPEGIVDGTLKQQHLIAGITYLPIPNVAIKADVRLLQTGDQNPQLLINPAPNALPYQPKNTFLNVGVGYSF
ncbi:MAG: hypothetical protein EOP52_00355 [Sphingobacteriales bacterium]|nr:MAG: hypothetical protein EOP52_00355 [Sphingobacteriales bacterium]